uniref:Essential meiotic structure-specific endonuclease 1 n=1 Tax=Oryzias melastigma TaxID=30732 RepID=A0A3B3CHI0_ORYME
MSGCSSSDLDEELPVFDFLQPSQRCSQISPTESDKAARTKQGAADVMTISSDSDDDYAPLAQRLKSNSDPSAVSNGKIPDCGSFFSRSSQNGIIVTEHAPGVRQEEPQSLETSPARRKLTKRTREEIQTSREEALRRRQEKEEQEKQKAEKRAVAEAAKALRPDECIKHMVVAVDPALLQLEGGGALLASLQALGCSCAIEKQPLPRSVSWARRAPPTQVRRTKEQKAGRSDSAPSLTTWVQQQQRRQPSKTLSLAASGKVTAPFLLSQQAVVQLQLHSGISVHFLPSWKEFADYIAMTTKAVAEAPFKREREKTGFSFYLESEWAGGHRVDRGGRGLLQVWKRQIQQFNRVSPDMAAAILAAYPSPQLLLQAYAQCHTESERMSLLSDLLIRRGEGVTSTTRRVGPELSKRIFLAMHSPDPEQTLDSSL